MHKSTNKGIDLMETYYSIINTPIGDMIAIEGAGSLIVLEFFSGVLESSPLRIQKPTPLLKQTELQLDEYFAKARQAFSLPLNPKGTSFQTKAWQALQTIPYGNTISYGEQALRLGNPNASRAVGRANSKNPIAIVIPCHRVIGKNGSLTGYGGGLDKKKCLLDHEAN